MIQVEVVEIDDAHELPDDLMDGVDNALFRIAELLRDVRKIHSPVRTGRYRRSIQVKNVAPLTYIVAPIGVPYARYVKEPKGALESIRAESIRIMEEEMLEAVR